ncbi:MAG: transposase [Gammaproteobacteria bacterium]|nr:transposase [Gammaproteobacteria bacterium]
MTAPVPASRYVGCQIRLYPNRAQAALLGRSVEVGRELWNAMLEATIAHQERTGKFLGRAEREQFVKRWKAGAPVAAGVPANALYRVARDMGQALANWQRRRKHGKPGGFPKYRSRYGRQTGIYQAGKSTHIQGRRAWLAKVGWVRWRGGELPSGRLVSGRVWLDAGGRWTLSLAYDCPPLRPSAPTVSKVGIALGESPLAVVHDGTAVSTVTLPEAGATAERRLEKLERLIVRSGMRCEHCSRVVPYADWLAARAEKKQKARCGHALAGYRPSARGLRLRERRALARRRTMLQRRDLIHKASTAAVTTTAEIAIGEHRTESPHEAPAHIRAAAGEFVRQIQYKAAWHRRRLVVAPRELLETVSRCHACGHAASAPPRRAGAPAFRCGACGQECSWREHDAAILYRLPVPSEE